MAAALTGWAERAARLEHERAVGARGRLRVGERLELATFSGGDEMEERRLYVAAGADIDDVSHGQTMRAAVNDLQYRLLMLDPQADVYEMALDRLMTAAGADRVCAFLNCADGEGGGRYALHAEAVVSPDFSLISLLADRKEAHDDFAPGLYGRLATGEPFGSRTEFLPSRSAADLTRQGVEATLLLPLFVGGVFHGFLRLDHCDHARLWGEGETSILVSAANSISAAIDRQLVVAKLVQRSHELAALLTTSRAITSSIDYDVVLQEVACAAAEALVCPESVIWEYSGRSDIATYRVCYQRDPDPASSGSLVGTTYYASDYPGGMRAVRDGIVAVQSLSDAAMAPAERARLEDHGEKTRLSVPLVYNDEVLGMMILVETERERRFTPDEVSMARVIGEQAAAALHNARLHRREEDQHRWLAALAEATRVIASRLDRSSVLRDVAGLATKALLVDRALVYEWDDRAASFVPCAADSAVAACGYASAAAAVDAALTAALRDGECTVKYRNDADLGSVEAARMDQAGEQVVVWVPFRIKDETLGAMRLGDRSRDRRFAGGELSFAQALGEHAAIALNNARLYAQIEDLAMKDGLTGLANHRHFYDRLAGEIERGRRNDTPVALLMLDIDDFKRLNDTYGHPAGDEVLRLIGRLMTVQMRQGGDLAARYGGEEFCVLLPNTAAGQHGGRMGARPVEVEAGHEEGAAAVAERLRRRIAEYDFPIGSDGAPVRLTVSIGVAAFPATAGDMDTLVGNADAALYSAKHSGKNRVRVY